MDKGFMSIEEAVSSPGGWTCHKNIESSDFTEKSNFKKLPENC